VVARMLSGVKTPVVGTVVVTGLPGEVGALSRRER